MDRLDGEFSTLNELVPLVKDVAILELSYYRPTISEANVGRNSFTENPLSESYEPKCRCEPFIVSGELMATCAWPLPSGPSIRMNSTLFEALNQLIVFFASRFGMDACTNTPWDEGTRKEREGFVLKNPKIHNVFI